MLVRFGGMKKKEHRDDHTRKAVKWVKNSPRTRILEQNDQECTRNLQQYWGHIEQIRWGVLLLCLVMREKRVNTMRLKSLEQLGRLQGLSLSHHKINIHPFIYSPRLFYSFIICLELFKVFRIYCSQLCENLPNRTIFNSSLFLWFITNSEHLAKTYWINDIINEHQ